VYFELQFDAALQRPNCYNNFFLYLFSATL
jgi:hypothetical protein